MNKSLKIIHLSNKEIDYQKWDKCINNASNRNLYAHSWFLDVVNPNWEAFIFGDYEYVMPLPVKKKFCITAIFQPLHCQQLGIFPVPTPEVQEKFGQQLFNSFRIIQYQLNSAMNVNSFSDFQLRKKKNYILSLTNRFEDIYTGFSTNTKRNIKKAEKSNVKVIKGLSQSDFFSLKKSAVKRKIPEKSYSILNKLMSRTIAGGKGTIYAAYSEINSLCAAAFVITDGNKMYYLNAFSSEKGKQNRAMYSIVNNMIKECSQRNITIDFEGSMIDGVARFYEGFGATSEDYYFSFINKLPFLKRKI